MNPRSPLLKSAADERSLRMLIFQKVESIGPSFTTIVENLWVRTQMSTLVDIERFLKLAATHCPNRLEAASRRALFYGHGDYHTVEHILTKHLYNLPLHHRSDINGQLLLWHSGKES